MKDIFESKDLPEKEKIYLKKDYLGWKVVHPISIDGKINWLNLLIGGKRNAITLFIYLIIIVLLYLGINEVIDSWRFIAENPCDFCNVGRFNVFTP